MAVVKSYSGWTFKDTKDCFGDRKTSFYVWPTKEQARLAEQNMLTCSLATKRFNEGKSSHVALQDIYKNHPTY